MSEAAFIGMYGAGRSPLREAMKLLTAENVVEVRHGKGAFICERTGITSDPLGLKYTDQARLIFNLFETRLTPFAGILPILPATTLPAKSPPKRR